MSRLPRHSVREIVREFQPLGIRAELTRGGHVALMLPNGERVYMASTPSDQRAIRHVRAQVRRAMRRAQGAVEMVRS